MSKQKHVVEVDVMRSDMTRNTYYLELTTGGLRFLLSVLKFLSMAEIGEKYSSYVNQPLDNEETIRYTIPQDQAR